MSTTPPPGWYPNRSQPWIEHWFDGQRWTEHWRHAGPPIQPPVLPPTPPVPGQYQPFAPHQPADVPQSPYSSPAAGLYLQPGPTAPGTWQNPDEEGEDDDEDEGRPANCPRCGSWSFSNRGGQALGAVGQSIASLRKPAQGVRVRGHHPAHAPHRPAGNAR